ncbi:hypothetical protein BDR07DRAFT_819454 [Suillus spraguei]|nr:hypothetical protein BDR07DRAFT_819454 [Suillus spraguei]
MKPRLPHTDTGTTLFIRNIPFIATEDELQALFRTFGALQYARIRKRSQGRKSKSVKQAKIVRQHERVDPVTGKGRSKGHGLIEMEMSWHADALRVLRWANNNPAVAPLLSTWWKEELGDLIKLEKGKGDPDEARLKRMKDELEGQVKIPKGTLIVEFSIENVQVVQRRAN